MLDREEYVEQAHFFRVLSERLPENVSTQELLRPIREEILATTKLPMAIDFLLAELKHSGTFAPAMRKLDHYFTAFQTYTIDEAEDDRGRFDLRIALEILRREAEYRAAGANPQAIFLYQFEALCRNRLRYDRGLDAIAADPVFDERWRSWIASVRRRVGMADFADLIYVASTHYAQVRAKQQKPAEPDRIELFGEPEGRIALANRRKDPLLLFAALHRQLNYPEVPVPKPVDQEVALLPLLARRLERLEHRMKLIEEEQRGGIDLSKFYGPPKQGES